MNKSDEIFLLNGENLEPLPARTMREGFFGETLEAALQRFFEKYPQIIPGKQINPGSDDPPRFVLLRREMPIGGWSLDHLFVDQNAVLTLVETKLFQNPQSRREVVGQIIEYAANATEYWSKGQARQNAGEYWNKQGKNLDDLLKAEFDQDLDVDGFWNTVEKNLENGVTRLIIATDELRPEVRRMIEYLNNEMEHTEVLGLELKFYGSGQENCVLVPRLVGQTQSTIDKKPPSGDRQMVWSVDMLRSAYTNDKIPNNYLSQRLRNTLEWAVKNNIFIKTNSHKPTFGIQDKNGKRMISFSPDGSIYPYLNYSNDEGYLGGIEGREQYVIDLKALNLLDQTLNLADVVSGRTATRKLQDLDDDEYSQLLSILEKYSKQTYSV